MAKATTRKPAPREEPAPYATIGWQGVTVEAPEDWSPTSVSSEGESGYLKIISPDTRLLEIKWEKPKGVVSVPDALERYLKQLQKRSRKGLLGKSELQVSYKPRQLARVRPDEQAPATYSWEMLDRRAYGVVWHCGECKRLVIAEVVGQAEDDFAEAARILGGIREHGEPGWNCWAMYGVAAHVPADYRIERHQLMTGYLKFPFRRRDASLTVERWGLANLALKGATLRQWWEARERMRLLRFAYRIEEVEMHGHTVLQVQGRERLAPALWHSFQTLSRLNLPGYSFRGYVWECPESNKIFAVTGQEGRKSTVVADVARRLQCHGKETTPPGAEQCE